MKKQFLFGSMLFISSIVSLTSCYKKNLQDFYPACDTSNVTYNGTIKQIMSSSCTTSDCHNAASQAGGYDLSTYSNLLPIAQGGTLLTCITRNSPPPMPKGNTPLDACTIAKIRVWVNASCPQ